MTASRPSHSTGSGSKNGQKTLLFLAVVMLINALSYGTIIPLMYPYADRFGMNAVGLSLLFASFSLFQFLATPVIGRLSDIYGRRPLLLGSVLGTGVSLALFAMATSIPMLFVARILDGITGGNMSVAQAVIADKLHGKERAKAFGLLGASFGFGFLAGPALGGLLSDYGLTTPFWVASGLAILASVFGYFFLPETLPIEKRSKHEDEPIFHFGRFLDALKTPIIGLLVLTIFTISLAQNSFIIGFNAFTVDVLKLNPKQIGLIFASTGLINIFVQAVGIRLLLNKFHNHERVLITLQIASMLFIGLLALASRLSSFMGILALYVLFNAPLQTILSSMVSDRVDPQKQGTLLGVATSYMSLGQIGGPLLAGLVVSTSVPGVFVVCAVLFMVSLVISYRAAAHAELHAKIQGVK